MIFINGADVKYNPQRRQLTGMAQQKYWEHLCVMLMY